VRVTGFSGAAFDMELFAYGKTSDWTHLTAIRQDILFKIATIVEAAGTAFAAPTRLTYQAKDPGVDTDKADDIVRQVAALRANNAFLFPGEVQAATK
jgi:MscS family membrane protein